MKTLRLCLLIVLALLLPIRAAVGAAMLCPPMGSGSPAPSAGVEHHPAVTTGGHEHRDDRAYAEHRGQEEAAGPHDQCNLCAAFCSVEPILIDPPTMAVPCQVFTVTFPLLAALPSSFVSGGQDRPPRPL